jgi:FkbM family methyltransferase
MRLPVDLTFSVNLPDGNNLMYCSTPNDNIGRALYWKELTYWEAETIPVFYLIAKHSKTILDIGANTGFYTLLGCAANQDAIVYSFEPVPKVYNYLLKNINLNGFQGRCRPKQVAVTNTVGKSKFCELEGDVPTSSSLDLNGFRGQKGNIYEVETINIDTLCLFSDTVNLIKIDVEGFEDIVLKGSAGVIEKFHPAVIVECNFDGPYMEVEGYLLEQGYSIYHINANGLTKTNHIIPDRTGKFLNFLGIPDSNMYDYLFHNE